MVKTIEIEQALQLAKQEEVLFIDTRSPKEFEEDNIFNSINIPIFSNEEREVIGTLYKQNQVQAYQEGFAVYNKKIMDFITAFKEIPEETTIIIYCWRGGMRSKTIAELASSIGKKVYQLTGGYKSFRAYIRNYFENYVPKFSLLTLQGMAGTGKTKILQTLKPALHLERIAQHRSSLFGDIGLKPHTQKYFESRLYQEIEEQQKGDIVFIEGEARKIGDLHIPEKLYEQLHNSPTILITANIKQRSEQIVNDYFTHGEDKHIKEIIMKLKEHLSNKVALELCELVDKKEYEEVAQTLLETYYDKQYKHALIGQEYISTIHSDDIKETITELERIREQLLEKK